MSKTRGIRKANATDVVVDAGIQGDDFPRIEVRAGGTIWTGDGTEAPVTQLGTPAPADPPLITSGEPTDDDFDSPPPNGTIAIDGDTDVAYYRKAGVWTPIGAPAAPTEPGAPTIGVATAGDTTATINWTAGASGGSAITGYEVTLYLDADDTIIDTQTVGLVLTFQFTSLVNGDAVYGKVAAINAIGTGPQSAASNVVTPDVGAFDPATLNPLLWARAKDLTPVADGTLLNAVVIPDNSGTGNTLVTEATGCTYKTAAALGMPNPMIRLDGVSGRLTRPGNASLISPPSQPFTIYFAMWFRGSVTGVPASALLYPISHGIGAYDNFSMHGPGQNIFGPPPANSNTEAHSLVFIFDGASSFMCRDDDAGTTGNAGTGTPTIISIGATDGLFPSGFAQVDLGEILIFAGHHSAGERTSMFGYLRSEWDTP